MSQSANSHTDYGSVALRAPTPIRGESRSSSPGVAIRAENPDSGSTRINTEFAPIYPAPLKEIFVESLDDFSCTSRPVNVEEDSTSSGGKDSSACPQSQSTYESFSHWSPPDSLSFSSFLPYFGRSYRDANYSSPNDKVAPLGSGKPPTSISIFADVDPQSANARLFPKYVNNDRIVFKANKCYGFPAGFSGVPVVNGRKPMSDKNLFDTYQQILEVGFPEPKEDKYVKMSQIFVFEDVFSFDETVFHLCLSDDVKWISKKMCSKTDINSFFALLQLVAERTGASLQALRYHFKKYLEFVPVRPLTYSASVKLGDSAIMVEDSRFEGHLFVSMFDLFVNALITRLCFPVAPFSFDKFNRGIAYTNNEVGAPVIALWKSSEDANILQAVVDEQGDLICVTNSLLHTDRPNFKVEKCDLVSEHLYFGFGATLMVAAPCRKFRFTRMSKHAVRVEHWDYLVRMFVFTLVLRSVEALPQSQSPGPVNTAAYSMIGALVAHLIFLMFPSLKTFFTSGKVKEEDPIPDLESPKYSKPLYSAYKFNGPSLEEASPDSHGLEEPPCKSVRPFNTPSDDETPSFSLYDEKPNKVVRYSSTITDSVYYRRFVSKYETAEKRREVRQREAKIHELLGKTKYRLHPDSEVDTASLTDDESLSSCSTTYAVASTVGDVVYRSLAGVRSCGEVEDTPLSCHRRKRIAALLSKSVFLERAVMRLFVYGRLGRDFVPDSVVRKTAGYWMDPSDKKGVFGMLREAYLSIPVSLPRVRFSRKISKQYLTPSLDMIRSPVFDLIMTAQRLLLTAWGPGDSYISRASFVMEISVLLAKIWEIVPKTRLEWMNVAFQEFSPTFEFQGPDAEKSSWLSALMSFDGTWETAKAGTKDLICKIISFSANLPLLWASYLEKETWTERVSMFAQKCKNTNQLSLMVDGFFDCIEVVLVMCGSGSLAGRYSSQLREAEEAYTNAVRKFREYDMDPQPEAYYTLVDTLTDVIADYEKINNSLSDRQALLAKTCSERILALDALVTRAHAICDACSGKIQGHGVMLTGGPGLGKSFATELIIRKALHAIGKKAKIGNFNEESEYHEGIKPSHNAIIMEDCGKTERKYCKNPPGGFIIGHLSCAPSPLLSPIAEKKEDRYSHILFVGANSNQYGGGLLEGVNEVGAVGRRLSYWEVTANEEKAEKVGTVWKPKKEFVRPVSVPTHLFFEEYIQVGTGKVSNFKKTGRKMEWDEFSETVCTRFKAHYDNQVQSIQSKKSLDICQHGCFMGNCKFCTPAKFNLGFPVGRHLRLGFQEFLLQHCARFTEMEVSDLELLQETSLYWIIISCVGFACCTVVWTNVTGAAFWLFLCAYHMREVYLSKLAVLARPATEATVEELHESVISPSNLAKYVIGGGLCLATLAQIVRTLRAGSHVFQSGSLPEDGSTCIECPTEEDDKGEVDPEPEEMVMEEASAEALAVYEMYKKKRDNNEEWTVPEVKKLIKHEDVVSSLAQDYWTPPNRIHPTTPASSGAQDHLLKTVKTQVWQIRPAGKKMVDNMYGLIVCDGFLLFNSHYLTKHLVEESLYTLEQLDADGLVRSRNKRFRNDDVLRGPEGSDWSLWHVGNIGGTKRSLIKYFTDEFESTSGLHTKLVRVKPSTFIVEACDCVTDINPQETAFVDATRVTGVARSKAPFPPYPGLCGAVLVGKCIFGIHSFCPAFKMGFKDCGATLVKRSDLESLISRIRAPPPDNLGPLLKGQAINLEEEVAHRKNPLNFLGPATVDFHCHTKRLVTMRSAYVENPFAARMEELLGVPIVGTKVRPGQSYNKVAHKVLTTCGTFKGSPTIKEITRAVDMFTEGLDEMVTLTFERKPFLSRMPFTQHEAINGVEGHPYANGFDLSKSAGAGAFCKKVDCVEGEKPHARFKRDWNRDFQVMEARRHRGENSGNLGSSLAKDEALPPGKDTRGFVATGIMCQCQSNMDLAPILHFLQAANSWACNVVGMDPGGSEWDEYAKRLTQCVEGKYLSLDFSSYDLTHSSTLKLGAVMVIERIAKAIGYTEEEVKRSSMLYHELENMSVNFQGPIVDVANLWPSGVTPTAIMGATKTVLMLLMAIDDQFPGLENWREKFVIRALGDDNLTGHLDPKVVLDTSRVYKNFEKHGMTVTSDQKTAEIHLSDFDAISFLSRSFFYNPDLKRWVGVLKDDSKIKPLALWKKPYSKLEAMTDLARNHMRETALEGRESFNRYQHAYRTVFTEQGWPLDQFLYVTYDEYIEMMRKRDEEHLNSVRYRFQAGDIVEADSEVKDTVEIREVVETDEVQTSTDGPVWDKSLDRSIVPELALPPMVGRESLLVSLNLPNDAMFDFEVNPLEALMANEFRRDRLKTYHALRTDLEVRFTTSGTKFHYGEIVASVIYNDLLTDFQNENSLPRDFRSMLATQRPHVRFQVGTDEFAVLTIPWVFIHAMIPHYSATINNYCKVRIHSVTPVRCAVDDAPQEASLTVYARMIEPKAIGHSPNTFQGPTVPEEGPPKPSAIMGGVARAAAVAGHAFPPLAVPAEMISGVAGAASHVLRALGHSKPLDYGTSPYIPYAAGPTASANSDIAGRPLTYDVHQGVTLDSILGGREREDPLAISNLVSKPIIVKTGQLTQNTGVDNPFLTVNVTPLVFQQNGSDRCFAPSGMVSLMRRMWHGTMCYRLSLKTTALTGGKLIASYNALGRQFPSPGDTHTLRNQQFDLKASHQMTIKVHWHQHMNMLLTCPPVLENPFDGSYRTQYHNGSVQFAVLQPIVGTKDNQIIDYVLECWMENEFFCDPSYYHLGLMKIRDLIAEEDFDGQRRLGKDGDSREFDGSAGPTNEVSPVDEPNLQEGAPLVPFPGDLVSGVFSTPWNNRARARSLRFDVSDLAGASVVYSMDSVSTPSPTTVAPQPAPSQLPTFGPTALPTTYRPTAVPTRTPTFPPTGSPTVTVTAAPTVGICGADIVSVDQEFVLARNGWSLEGLTGNWSSSGGTAFIGNSLWSLNGATMIVEFNETPTSVSPEGTVVGVIQGNTVILTKSTNGQDLTNVRATVSFATTDPVQVLSAQASVPGGTTQVERLPPELAGLLGLLQTTVTIDSFPFDAVEVPQDTEINLNFSEFPAECARAETYGRVAFIGQFEQVGGTVRTGNPSVWDFVSSDMRLTARNGPAYILALYDIALTNVFNGPLDEAPSTFEIGSHTPIQDALARVHAGEELLSLRQDLRVFRPNVVFEVPPGQDFDWQARLHAPSAASLGPYELLLGSFLGVRGGMVGWYKIEGEGNLRVQRGQAAYPGSVPSSDLMRGYEYVDSWVNPSGVFRFPWYSLGRFDYARYSFAGSLSNVRNVKARNTSPTTTMVVHEDLAVSEDFSLIHFMGCPILTTDL